MNNGIIALKTVNEILGMNFFIPDYQRGYRWEPRQAKELLDDILAFSKKAGEEEIYCIQPLVVCSNIDKQKVLEDCKNATTIDEIAQIIKGSWRVVDGQQRLTTIFLILSYLGFNGKYELKYETRQNSQEYLKNIESSSNNKNGNIDFYHMFEVYCAIKEWFGGKEKQEKETFKEVLLNKVCFIWYEVQKEEEISVFTRLNIGKIPLTDAELIKALFLNRTNFNVGDDISNRMLEKEQLKIASEWDTIEKTLQDDEFWMFLNDANYDKPTRIDFILNIIEQNDCLKVYRQANRKRGKNKTAIENSNEILKAKIGNDEHSTFRYFNEAFNMHKKEDDWIFGTAWEEVKRIFQIFSEWYYDYRFYHYIGYLTTIGKIEIKELLKEWGEKTKDAFCNHLKDKIVKTFEKEVWIRGLKDWSFDEPYVSVQTKKGGQEKSKRECVGILLLHNVETIIQQNQKMVEDKKYSLPNFTKFPFHLYKKDNWQVEHIRPNAGDKLDKEENKKLYLSIAKDYVSDELKKDIDNYINSVGNKKDFSEILDEVLKSGDALSDEDKNKIWNFVLLDESTNKEYGNQIFPIKRAFISNKEKGFKVTYSWGKKGVEKSKPVKEISFVPLCTKNVFSKFYTEMPTSMVNWTKDDAENYWKDICEKLKYYFVEWQVKEVKDE